MSTLYKPFRNDYFIHAALLSQNELSSPIRSFLCPIPVLACKQCIFKRFKVYKFSLGLCLNNKVKEKQLKWSIVIPYDVYQQQVYPKVPKNAVPSS